MKIMTCYISGIRRLGRFARRALLPFRSRVVILLYHRVFEAPSDPQLLCVTPNHFAEHIEYLRQHYQIISLGELGRALREKLLPNRAVVITFDDGYADNLFNAKPLLERYDLPATVFVTASHIGQNREFWWDELESLLLEPGKLPQKLNLSLAGKVLTWNLNGAEVCSKADFNRYRTWNVTLKNCPTLRHELYRKFCGLLHSLPYSERNAVLTELATWAGRQLVARSGYRVLTSDEVVQLAKGGLIEVGSHTQTHDLLSTLPTIAQHDEIHSSRIDLERILGCPVTAFSYPYGSWNSIGPDAVRLVQEEGYDIGCANFPWPVTNWANPFLLPRYLVRDWSCEQLAGKLRRFFRGSA